MMYITSNIVYTNKTILLDKIAYHFTPMKLFLFSAFCVNCCNVFIVPSLTLADIISTRHVHSEMDCAFGCLDKPTCVGFKFRDNVSCPSVNCQLSNTSGESNMAVDDEKGWKYFIDVS